jgi:hypothetical protein
MCGPIAALGHNSSLSLAVLVLTSGGQSGRDVHTVVLETTD